MTLDSCYDEIADRYARWWAPVLAPSARTLLDLIADIVEDREHTTILDLGTGTGTVAAAALSRWPSVTVLGVDRSGRMLDLATVAASAAPARFRPISADASELPVADASVDAVTSSFVLQLVDARRALGEAHRVLRPGGRLAVVTWVGPDAPFEPDLALDDALDELELDMPDDDEEDDDGGPGGHFETPSALADLVQEAGFAEVRVVEGTLVHGFNPATYGQFLEEYGERSLFESLAPEDARRLRRLTDKFLRHLEPDAFLWQTPIVTVTATR